MSNKIAETHEARFELLTFVHICVSPVDENLNGQGKSLSKEDAKIHICY